MNYPNQHEYDDVTMLAMENAIRTFYKHGDIEAVEFYKMDDRRNVVGKIDGQIIVTLNNRHEMNLQIKRSDKYRDSFSVKGSTLRDYITGNFNIQGLLIGLAYDENMYLFRWNEFVDFASEVYPQWKSKHGDYYVIQLGDLTDNLYYRELPYDKNDYEKLANVWE